MTDTEAGRDRRPGRHGGPADRGRYGVDMDAIDYLIRGLAALAVFGVGVVLARFRWKDHEDETPGLGLD